MPKKTLLDFFSSSQQRKTVRRSYAHKKEIVKMLNGNSEKKQKQLTLPKKVERPKIEVEVDVKPRKKEEQVREGGVYYLMQVKYDGKRRKAVVLLYDPQNHKFIEWVDSYGHKPYFLTDLPPDKLREIRKLVKHPAFDGYDVVVRYDLLYDRERRMTKVYTKDPLAIKTLRNYVPKAWEAKIKYHDNYIYDIGLVPMMKYTIKNGKLLPVPVKISKEDIERLNEAFKNERQLFKSMARSWLPFFEADPPHIKFIAMDIEVYTPTIGRVPNATTAPYPVISIAFASNDGLKKVLVLMRDNIEFGEEFLSKSGDVEVEFFDDERSLLMRAFELIRQYPILVTYNGDNFDLNYLYHRALVIGIPYELIPFKPAQDRYELLHGLHIDLYQFYSINAIKVYAFGNKYKETGLDAVAHALLGEGKVELAKPISELSYSELVKYNFRDARLTMELLSFNDYLPWKLIVLLCRISKLGVEDVTRLQVSLWIRSLMFWEHRRRGYLIPLQEDIKALKSETRSSATIKGKKYQGAIVVDPATGAFFDVIVLDFASLYPSIIKQYNLSYETINCPHEECRLANDNRVPEVGHWICKKREGISSVIVGVLRDYRVKIYKKRAKDKSLPDDVRQWYDVVQMTMKVYINASYGVFGAETFDFYCPPAAESVTALGRHTIKSTMNKAKEMGIVVLYGDTDSMFLWNPPKDKLEEIIKWVNETFGLEIEVDKVYRFVTFSGLKKNYIGVYPDGSVDVKGLLGKKRNTPDFIKAAFNDIVKLLGTINSPEEFIHVRQSIKSIVKDLFKGLREKWYNLDELAFRMQLTKPLNAYTKNTPQHVKAAKMLERFGVTLQPGDVIAFVKVKGREGVKPVQLAKLPEIDIEKYYDAIEGALGQILTAMDFNTQELRGISKLELFLTR